MCAPCKPIKAMNNPIPQLTPFLSVRGMALKIASLTLVSDNTMKISPSTNTAARAICHEYPIAPQTVNAKYALSPIPGASANG